jgi:predicted enzyme related to lactoylglutathione lyase
MGVTETFFALVVCDMKRSTDFYVHALGAEVTFPSPTWSSLRIAGVRVGLFCEPSHAPTRTGLHFVVTDLDRTRRDIERAGGQAAADPTEVAPGVVVADAIDTEGNTFSLRQG